jgi:hypothetical protein
MNSSLSHEPGEIGVSELASVYLRELEHAGRSAHTVRAYRSELARLATFHPGTVREVDAAVLRRFLATRATLAAASRARTHAALASFLAWCYRHDHIDADPIARIERVRVPEPAPRGLPAGQVEQILAAIPRTRHRDLLLLTLIASTGLRASEALSLYVEDLDLTQDDEHLTVTGKGERRRTVLLDDPRLVASCAATSNAPATATAPCSAPRRTGAAARSPTNQLNAAGSPTPPRPASRRHSTNSATATRPSSSTTASASKRSANASATRTSRPRCATPSRPTPPPTTSYAAGAAARRPHAEPPARRSSAA